MWKFILKIDNSRKTTSGGSQRDGPWRPHQKPGYTESTPRYEQRAYAIFEFVVVKPANY